MLNRLFYLNNRYDNIYLHYRDIYTINFLLLVVDSKIKINEL